MKMMSRKEKEKAGMSKTSSYMKGGKKKTAMPMMKKGGKKK